MEPTCRVVDVIKSTQENSRSQPCDAAVRESCCIRTKMNFDSRGYYFAATSFSNCVSSKIGTPKDFAFSSFDPASVPTTT